MAEAHEQTAVLFAASAEEALQASEIHSRAVLEVLPIGLAILDNQSQLVYSNRRYVELRGVPSGLAAWAEAIHPADRERVLNSRNQALARGQSWADTYRFVHANGTTVWVSARAVPPRASSDPAEFALTLEDVTATKIAVASGNHYQGPASAGLGACKRNLADSMRFCSARQRRQIRCPRRNP